MLRRKRFLIPEVLSPLPMELKDSLKTLRKSLLKIKTLRKSLLKKKTLRKSLLKNLRKPNKQLKKNMMKLNSII